VTGLAERRLLLLSMYPLDTGTASGPTVRISHLRDQLALRVRLEVVLGARWSRGWALMGYVAQGRLRGLSGVYVESSTALPGPIDLLVMALARFRRLPVLTYIRNAYQLFPEYYVADSWKRRISRAAFRPSIWLLARASTNVVRGAECGVVVPDTAEGLAAEIAEVVSATPDRIRAWGEAGRRAAAENSWQVRADRILELLGVRP